MDVVIVSHTRAWEEVISQWNGKNHVITVNSPNEIPQSLAVQRVIIIDDMALDNASDTIISKANGAQVVVLSDRSVKLPEYSMAVWLKKPVQLQTLLQVLIQSSEQLLKQQKQPLVIGRFIFSFQNKTLEYPELKSEVRLTEKEVSLIRLLYEAGDTGVQKDKLLVEVWGYHPDMDTHTVETHIYRLRQKIAEYCPNEEFIVTEGDRYRLKQ